MLEKNTDCVSIPIDEYEKLLMVDAEKNVPTVTVNLFDYMSLVIAKKERDLLVNAIMSAAELNWDKTDLRYDSSEIAASVKTLYPEKREELLYYLRKKDAEKKEAENLEQC